jgi:dihydroflavonol-4-reductase
MADLLALVNQIAGRTSRPIRLSVPVLWPLAVASEWTARAFNIDPLVTRDHLRMARKKMFFSSAKAEAELGYTHRPPRDAVADAIAWFATRR